MDDQSRATALLAQQADPITTELIRNALTSAAGEMRQVLMRTAFSQLIYEVLDFACGLYDRKVRLLAQTPSLALFLGTLDACVREAVNAIGGADRLRPGDILVYNIPYGTGSHPQDCALVMPAFVEGQLVGYAVCKAHWVDIGGKDVYSTDTIDVQQEGTFFPGVHLFREGERVDGIWRTILANSRAPELLAGDINAQIGAVKTGAAALEGVVNKHGWARFDEGVEQIFAHGEASVRTRIREIPDGRYETDCLIDNDGLDERPIPFRVVVEITGDRVLVDLTEAPDQTVGPINSPLPGTLSAARVALAALVSYTATPEEGQFRPLELRTRQGSIFEPVTPAPAFSFWVAQVKLIDGIVRALASVVSGLPADSGGDILAVVWWGTARADFQHRASQSKEPWIDGSPAPVGQGADEDRDGANALMHIAEACTRIAPAEVWEANNPWVVERFELDSDSGGAGRHQGGLGVVCKLRALEDCFVTAVLEGTARAPQGARGGAEARATSGHIEYPDGTVLALRKGTAIPVPTGAVYTLRSGGGGGYGEPAERDVTAVASDLANEYISRDFARRWYPGQLLTADRSA